MLCVWFLLSPTFRTLIIFYVGNVVPACPPKEVSPVSLREVSRAPVSSGELGNVVIVRVGSWTSFTSIGLCVRIVAAAVAFDRLQVLDDCFQASSVSVTCSTSSGSGACSPPTMAQKHFLHHLVE